MGRYGRVTRTGTVVSRSTRSVVEPTMTYLDGMDYTAAQQSDQDLKNTWAEVIARFINGNHRHGNLVHASPPNITPYPRKIVYLTLNAVSNYIRTPTRPEYIAHRDFTPIQTVEDDALLRLARAHRQAAE